MKINRIELGMRVRQVSTGREGTVVCVHFGAVEIDWGEGCVTAVEQNDQGELDLLLSEVGG